MKRRLVLARSLLNSPELLILDEPTTGLDPQSRHQVWNRLEELKSRGLTILLTTHYMEEAARLCDRLIIIDHGRVLVEGKPTELVRRHVGGEVIEADAPDDRVRNFLREHKIAFEDLGHRLLIYQGADESLFERLARDFCREGCTLRQATLEDVFLRLTGRELRE
jgi:lipooligosaccharide transport system ATP-binding protein